MPRPTLPHCIAYLLLAACVGCEDLPDANYPLIDVPSTDVIQADAGRGGYEWRVENGNFPIVKPFDSAILQTVNQNRVRTRAVQLLNASAALPAYEPPEGTPEEIKQAIKDCLEGTPDNNLLLMTVPDTLAHAKMVVALSDSNERLLIVDKELELWNIQGAALICRLPLPSPEIQFAFLDNDGTTAFLFDKHKVYRVGLPQGKVDSLEVSLDDIRQVVCSTDKAQLWVNTARDLIPLNFDLQTNVQRYVDADQHETVQLSPSGNRLACYHTDGKSSALTVVELFGMAQPYHHKLRSLFETTSSLPVALNDIALGVQSHEVFVVPEHFSSRSMNGKDLSLAATFGTTQRIDAAWAASSELDSWLVLGSQTKSAGKENRNQYLLSDIYSVFNQSFMPTIVGEVKPDRMCLSKDASLFVPLYHGQPVTVHSRMSRQTIQPEIGRLIELLAGLVENEQAELAEAIIADLMSYADKSPCAKTRPLLDLLSPVAQRLARPLRISPNTFMVDAPTVSPALQAFTKKQTTLGRLVEAIHLSSFNNSRSGNQQLVTDSQKAMRILNTILAEPDAPRRAFTLFCELNYYLNGDPEAIAPYYTTQLERDPLNAELHGLMGDYFALDRMGEAGKSAAYLNELCELLPTEHRDPFYAVCSARLLTDMSNYLWFNDSSGIPSSYSSMSISGNTVRYERATLSRRSRGRSGISQVVTLSANDGLILDRQRISRGVGILAQSSDSPWHEFLDSHCWSRLFDYLNVDTKSELYPQFLRVCIDRQLFVYSPKLLDDEGYIKAVKELWKP